MYSSMRSDKCTEMCVHHNYDTEQLHCLPLNFLMLPLYNQLILQPIYPLFSFLSLLFCLF